MSHCGRLEHRGGDLSTTVQEDLSERARGFGHEDKYRLRDRAPT